MNNQGTACECPARVTRWDASTSSCLCNAGGGSQTWDPVLGRCTCPGNKTWNAASDTCECPGGEAWDDTTDASNPTCTCAANVAANFEWNATAGSCECINGEVRSDSGVFTTQISIVHNNEACDDDFHLGNAVGTDA